MRDNKLLVFLVVLFFAIFIFVCGVAVFQEIKLENSLTSSEKKEENKESEEKEKVYEVYDVNDSLVLELMGPVNIISMLDDDSLLTTLYGVNRAVKVEDLTDKQKFNLSLRYYMNSNNIKVDACGEGKTYEVKLDDLRTSYIKDDGYLEKIEASDDYVGAGEYSYSIIEDGFSVCGSIFGFEGPLRVAHEFEVVSAHREDNKMYINAKLIRYVNVPDKVSDPDNFYYETYDSYSDNALAVESFEESIEGSGFRPDLSKYATYEFVFEVDEDDYYFESVTKK
mgnify:CR=1 FL=1